MGIAPVKEQFNFARRLVTNLIDVLRVLSLYQASNNDGPLACSFVLPQKLTCLGARSRGRTFGYFRHYLCILFARVPRHYDLGVFQVL